MDSFQNLQSLIQDFCEDRQWDQFHGPKDLAIGLVTEASELLEIFRFQNELECQELLSKNESREKVGDELADVFFFLLRFCQKNNFDLEKLLKHKMEKNARRYPVETAKGSNLKSTIPS